ncbi:hypothetical protein ACFLVX_01225 [Chloroflexota bacterium]
MKLARFSFITTLITLGIFLFVFTLITLAPNTASAQGGNCLVYDFEGGNLPPEFATSGLAGHAEVLHGGSHIDPPLDFPAGDHFLLLSNGPGEVNPAFGPDLDGNSLPDDDTTIVSFNFNLEPEQLPAVLGFYWSFFTSEYDVEPYDDFFLVRLNGNPILTGSVPTLSASPFPDVSLLDGKEYEVMSPGFTNGSLFDEGRCDYQAFSCQIDNPGTYTLQFLVADQENHVADSGLLIDYITVECNEALPPDVEYTVGGEIFSVNKAVILAPWITLGVVILAGSMYLVRQRVHS